MQISPKSIENVQLVRGLFFPFSFFFGCYASNISESAEQIDSATAQDINLRVELVCMYVVFQSLY